MKIVDLIENLKIDLNYYKCLLVDGTWGIGKTYEANKFIKENKDYSCCYLSLYGKTDIEEIKSNIYKNINKKKKYTINVLMFIAILLWAIFQIIPTEIFVDFFNLRFRYYYSAKILLTAIAIFIGAYYTKESILKHFNTLRKAKQNEIIIFDDIERINEKLSLNELFSYIKALKKLNYKVILITNSSEIINKEKKFFNKHLEKVVDRTYNIFENDIDIATKLLLRGFNGEFEDRIKEFIKKHSIKNLRTVEKSGFLIKEILDIENKSLNNDEYLEIDNKMFDIIIIALSICVEFYDNIYETEYQNYLKEQQEKSKKENSSYFIFSNLYLDDNQLLSKVKKYYLEEIETIDKKIVNTIHNIFVGTNKKDELEKLKNELSNKDKRLPMYTLYKNDETIKNEINSFNLKLKNKQFNSFNEIIEDLKKLYSFFKVFNVDLNKEDFKSNIEDFLEFFNERSLYLNEIIFDFPENKEHQELNQCAGEIVKRLQKEKIINNLITTYNDEEYEYRYLDDFFAHIRANTNYNLESVKEEKDNFKTLFENNNCFIPNLDKEINELKWKWIHHLLRTLSQNINGKAILNIEDIKKMIAKKMNENLNNATETIGKYRLDYLINYYKLNEENLENKQE